jgi:hypothetical protein
VLGRSDALVSIASVHFPPIAAASDPLRTLAGPTNLPFMRMPGPALSCVIIAAVISAALVALGDTTWGVIGFVASGLFWAALYVLVGGKR